MKLAYFLLAIASLQAGPKVAFLDTRKALTSTSDGIAAVKELKTKFAPNQVAQESEEKELQGLQIELRNAPDNVSVKARIQALRRMREDRRSRFDAEQTKVLKDLTAKLMVVVGQYAKQKHFEAVIDLSDPKAAVLWRADNTDITDKIIKLYDARKP